MEDIYQTYIESQEKGQRGVAMRELSDMNPPLMNTMLERQSREEAIVKRAERKGKTVKDVVISIKYKKYHSTPVRVSVLCSLTYHFHCSFLV